MKCMNTHQRLLIFLVIVLALTGLLSPWFAIGTDWVVTRLPGVERFPFSRIFNRTFMFSGIVLFFLCRPLLRIGNLAELGFVSLRRGGGDLLRGWSLAVGSLAALLLAMSVAQVFEPYFRLSLSRSLSRSLSALLSGVFAGSLEEIFFRGILFKGMLQNGRLVRAVVLSNLFYSALHFVKPGEPYFVDDFDPLAGFRHLSYTFTPFLEPLNFLPGMFGLFLLGVVLSYAFFRTGNLYLAIGLHAGWIFGLKSVRVFGDYTRDDLGWLFGSTDPKIVSGVAAWIGIISVLMLVHWLTRNRCGLTSEQTAGRDV
jgi:membrane protease YdiL (CAAX protease family)